MRIPASLAGRLAGALRADALRTRLMKALSALGLYRRLTLAEVPLSDIVPARPYTVKAEARLLREDDLEAYGRFRPDADLGEIRDRLRAGQQCSSLWIGPRVVGASWAVRGRAWIAYLDRTLDLGPDGAYIYDSFTAPDLRGRQLETMRATFLRRTLREQGVRRAFAAALDENTGARRIRDKHAHRPVAVVGYWKLGPWRRDFLRWIDPGPAG